MKTTQAMMALIALATGCASTTGTDFQDWGPPANATDGGASDSGPASSLDAGARTDAPSTNSDGGPAGDAGADVGTSGGTGALVQGLAITDVAIFQGAKVTVVRQGQKATPPYVPVVAGRAGLMRVYVSGSFAKPVTAELHLNTNGTIAVLRDANRTLQGASNDAALASTFNIDIPAGALTPTTRFSIQLTDSSAATRPPQATEPARYPTDGSESALGAQSDGDGVTITIVPVQYGADGSNRLPDTSAAQLEIYRNYISQTYPVSKLNLVVHAPLPYSSAIGATSGNAWSRVLQTVLNLRQQDNAAANNYYYGIFEPAAPDANGGPNNYCQGGCILGIAPLTQDPNDTTQRGGVGAGYSGLMFATTMAQELGHACGINHAPYPAAGQPNAPASPDPNYPYAGALIGQWGYGIVDKQLYDATTYRDFMSYAQQKIWVSDYVQGLFFTRFKVVNSAQASAPARYRYINVDEHGSIELAGAATYGDRPHGEVHRVSFRDARGVTLATVDGQYFALEEIHSGYLVVPEPLDGYASVRVEGPRVIASVMRH
jgi:hypothetical protein